MRRGRSKAMTVAVIIAGLLPVLWRTGAGSEVMSRIAAPMIGGMITAPLLSLFIIPAAYKLMWLRRHRRLAANVCRPPAASNCRRVQPTFIVRAR
ncbi:AcrB/AcrD/AcrF family protein [Salmonella enterica subsp. enterica serovar Bahati]|nr:AcrB/AcrD/AcrF family protein [Salmonella enterica subsp. enterica serovar Bahati]